MGRNAPRFSRVRCASEMIAACAAFGANAPNAAGVGSLSGFKRSSSVSGACIPVFAAVKQVQFQSEFDQRIDPHAREGGYSVRRALSFQPLRPLEYWADSTGQAGR